MKVKLGQAVKMFFGNSSLEMVYFEAFANALDADAKNIEIDISANSYSQSESLQINIKDDGIGFTDNRYKKFCNLFDVEESSHKGLGRLVYLCYFDEVKVISNYNKNKQREFNFTPNFEEKDGKSKTVTKTKSGTSFSMSGYTLTKLKQHSFIQPKFIKQRLLEEFYPRLYKFYENKIEFKIVINSSIEGKNITETLSNKDISELQSIELDSSINLIDKFNLLYSIEESDPSDSSMIAALAVDNRTVKIDIISKENIPIGYKMIFILYSDWLEGKVDLARQNLTLSDAELKTVKKMFRDKVAEVIEAEVPFIAERNTKTKEILINSFPHLNGYFNTNTIGYASRNEVLKDAQDEFFKVQKEILQASSLTDEQYEKSIELSSRALTEYILFRQMTIEKLKATDEYDSEANIHNLIIPMKSQLDNKDLIDDLYRNNAWLLDDKYMTYETILSDKEMGEVVNYITQGEVNEKDEGRPDVALIFSNNPSETDFFDVVIIEIKKRGITLEENIKVITQLEKRARKLMKYYKNKIQRIWYYGIVEFNEELELALSGEYQELYSSGKVYYRENKVAIQKKPDIIVPIGVFVMDLDSMVNDADARNSTFLKLIKSKFS